MQTEDWRDLTEDDPHLLVQLRLRDVSEGGQNRSVQSGFRAHWLADAYGMMAGGGRLIIADGSQRSLRPGAEAMVRVHSTHEEVARAWEAAVRRPGVAAAVLKVWIPGPDPFEQPETWPGLPVGTRLGMYGHRPRRAARKGKDCRPRKLGDGIVLARVRLP